MNPEPNEDAPRGAASSIASCVSKWLRDKSSIPANGTKAACRASYSGWTLSRSAGCRPQSASRGSRASRGTAMLGRES